MALSWKAFFEVESVLEDEVASYLGYVFDSGARRVTVFWASEVVVRAVWEGSQVALVLLL